MIILQIMSYLEERVTAEHERMQEHAKKAFAQERWIQIQNTSSLLLLQYTYIKRADIYRRLLSIYNKN